MNDTAKQTDAATVADHPPAAPAESRDRANVSSFDHWTRRNEQSLVQALRFVAAIVLLGVYSLPLLFLFDEVVASKRFSLHRPALEQFSDDNSANAVSGKLLLQFLLGGSIAFAATRSGRRAGRGIQVLGTVVLTLTLCAVVALALGLNTYLSWYSQALRQSYAGNAESIMEFTSSVGGELVIALGAMLGLVIRNGEES